VVREKLLQKNLEHTPQGPVHTLTDKKNSEKEGSKRERKAKGRKKPSKKGVWGGKNSTFPTPL